MKKNYTAWALMVPSLILFTFFIWYPLIYGMVLSFSEVQGFKITGFAGFDNYISLFRQPVFWTALVNSFKYTFWSLAIGFVIPIFIAIILSELVHFSSVIRISMYFPNIIPIIATTLMWRYMMEPSEIGLFNSIIMRLGGNNFGWLQEKGFTIPLIVTTMTWKAAGATAILYIARIKGINQELYDAAALDGASIFQRIRYVTFPQAKNLARLLLILQILEVFKVLIEPMSMTGGGPQNGSMSLLLLNWKTAFENFRIAQASALGVVICIILMVLTLVYLKTTKENEVN